MWFADLQQPEESQAQAQAAGEHGPGRRKAAVRDPGVAVAAAARRPARKDQQMEAGGPDGLVGAGVAHLHWKGLRASIG